VHVEGVDLSRKKKMTDDIYITKEGLDELKEELKQLIDEKRPEVAKRIKSAREMGDISENAEYDAARQEQSFVEGRIEELEDVIKSAKVADNANSDAVGVGSKVIVHIDGDEEEFHIVGAPEADPMKRKISHKSPLGVALVGKKIGEKVEVDAPMGKLTYTVLKIK